MMAKLKAEVTDFQKIQIMHTLIRLAGHDGEVDFERTSVGREFCELLTRDDDVCSFLHSLCRDGVIYFGEFGEDGFAPTFVATVSERTHEYLADLIGKAEEEFARLEERITTILTFNPAQLSATLEDTSRKLDEADQIIGESEVLSLLKEPLRQIRDHFAVVRRVSDVYEDVYKSVIKPVQEESKSGIRTTVIWAIAAMVVSISTSLLIDNWSKVVAFVKQIITCWSS